MFKIDNKDTRMMPLTPCSSVKFVKFEQVNAGWVHFLLHDIEEVFYLFSFLEEVQ